MGALSIRASISLLAMCAALCVFAQTQGAKDEQQIATLMAALCDHSLKPADGLDPGAATEEREKSLEYFKDPQYQLILTRTGPIEMEGDGYAKVPVHANLKNGNEETEVDGTASFVKRNGVWYFANYDFLAFSTLLILVIVLGVAVGICFAGVVLRLWWKLKAAGRLDPLSAWKIFVPFCWPGLFRLLRQNK
jgi:uncharacterized protein YchJ